MTTADTKYMHDQYPDVTCVMCIISLHELSVCNLKQSVKLL